jgi:3-dehydroquinate synthase
MMKSMTVVKIETQPRSYEAVIESGLLARAGEQVREVAGGRQNVFVVTAPPVRRKWAKILTKSLSGSGFRVHVIGMPDGERHKKLATVENLAEQLAQAGADRDALLVAFGGGVVGDVTGLLASLYMRGVELVQVPTTVLAQVDASIGGKTGVNLRSRKNLIGTFQQPLRVLIDPNVLSSLPEREFRAGLYEALKCGVIGRPELFARLENADIKKLRQGPAELAWLIAEAVKLKAEVVSSDERESGLRRVLNLGHTIGHALEGESGYRRFLHGEAVAWGMIAAAYIAEKVGKCDAKTAERIVAATFSLGRLPEVDARSGDIVRLLQSDKKTRDGVVHFVLPTAIGKVEIVKDVTTTVVSETVSVLRRMSR